MKYINKKLYLIIGISFLSFSCHKDKNVITYPYQKDFYFLRMQYLGNDSAGCCGMTVLAIEQHGSGTQYFKPLKWSDTLKENITYAGKVEVLKESYNCVDCSVDPNPNKPAYVQEAHFVNILEIHKR